MGLRSVSLLLPAALARTADRLSLSDFLIGHGKTCFLLVKLDDLTGGLEAGLSGQPPPNAKSEPSLNALAFQTAMAEIPSVVPGRHGTREFDVAELRVRLSRASNYAVALDKRGPDGAYADRISLGRASNNDVVLRHASVSKFHAWFERDEAGTLCIADARSRNGTHVNDDKCAPRQLTAVKPGDLLRFGAVEAMVCMPETLWKALQAR